MFKMIRYILIKISPCSGSRPKFDNKVVFVIKYSKLYKKLLFLKSVIVNDSKYA